MAFAAEKTWFFARTGVIAAALALVLSALAGEARAAASPWVEKEESQVRLIAATEAVGRTGGVRLGLQFRMAPGWKVYWRSPGDAGFPPTLDWSGSENLADARIDWPAPIRFTIFGLETFGYEDEVVLPITARLEEREKPLRLRAGLDYLVCKEVCVPHKAELALALPSGPAAPGPFTHLIDRFSARVPGDGSGVGLAVTRVALAGDGRAAVLRVVARSELPFRHPDLFVEGPPAYRFDAPEVEVRGEGREAVLAVPVSVTGADASGLVGSRVTLTLVDGDRAMETAVPVQRAATGAESFLYFAGILALAVLGGLILNLMPCVLPVLSLKLLGVVSHGGQERARVRLSFLTSAAGILVSFLVLAGVALALKATGVAVGWGMQFQQPAFLVAMTLVVTLFACNLWGFFEIRLPRRLTDALAARGHGHDLPGYFLTGAFATLLATPCSAPFLGTALGFALARGPAEILSIFTALGLGLALPYLAVAAAPGLATRLPRPGRWMVVLRRVLGFALAGTGVWLVSVLAGQVPETAAYAVGALMVAVVLVLWFGARLGDGPRRAGMAATAVLAALAFVAPARLAGEEAAPVVVEKGVWRPFERAAIGELVRAGKVVFVDVTADWCITCQVNKSLVLERGEVAKRLAGDGVVAMRADWTRPSDEISVYLASFGRYGIPFNAVYGPGAPAGIALPELLTNEAVLGALERAAGEGERRLVAPAPRADRG